jgi:pyridoxal phosphate enzyme (YggS family)
MNQFPETQVNISENYHTVKERITNAARLAGRNPEDIRLVVVTKTNPIEVIQAVIDAGATDLGENYLDEAIPKIHHFTNDKAIKWHMIGHIQSRKAFNVCEYFHYAHSVDSIKLAERLSRFAVDLGKPLPIWLEFNVGGEPSKSGWNIAGDATWKVLLPDISKIFSLPGLIVLGVMTIPPFSDNSEESRPYYRLLRKFQAYVIESLRLSNFLELSIGMSSDFEVAIQEGSTCVRIGQAILGPRTV